MPDPAALDPLLIPHPRSLRLTGDSVDLRPLLRSASALPGGCWSAESLNDCEQVNFDTGPGNPESYRLEVSAVSGRARVAISAPDQRGRVHALRTLAQLLNQYGESERVPTLVIDDAPAFATRGVMLDVSRDRVPSMHELSRLTRELGSLKLNHLQLYTEHTFAYEGHEEAWQGWSPVTPDEVRTLELACGPLIELAANQNCFGHLSSWLRHPKYAALAETHGDWMFDIWPRSGPFSLCPTDPRSIEFVSDLLGQLLPCFSSPLVNIGCDETYDIAYGRSKTEVERRGRGAVYLDFVRQICGVVRAHGKRPMFWADIALSHPECVKDIPDDLISLAWGYEPDAPFDRWCGLLREHGREVWVCPGTSSWRSITGRTSERRGNIDNAAAAGQLAGAAGMLVCDWGDTGHHQQWPIALLGIAYGAAKAWNPQAKVNHRAVSLHVFGDRSLTVAHWLDDLGDADLPLRETCGELSAKRRVRLRNQSALFIDLFKKLLEQTDVGSPEAWQLAGERLEASSRCKPAGLDPLLDAELSHTLAVAHFAADRGAWRRQSGGLTSRQRDDLRARLEAIVQEHRRLWLQRSREGGLDHSCGYYREIDL